MNQTIRFNTGKTGLNWFKGQCVVVKPIEAMICVVCVLMRERVWVLRTPNAGRNSIATGSWVPLSHTLISYYDTKLAGVGMWMGVKGGLWTNMST